MDQDPVNISEGMQPELHRELLRHLDAEDRCVIDGYKPENIDLYQRINGRGMYWNDGRYLWMRLCREKGMQNFDLSENLYTETTIVKENIILHAINHLALEHRERLLAAIEADLEKFSRKTIHGSNDKVWATIDDLHHDRFLTFKDLALRGELEQIVLPQVKEGVTLFDPETLPLFFGDSAPPTEADDIHRMEEEGEMEKEELDEENEFGSAWLAQEREKHKRESLERQRLNQEVLRAWRKVAPQEEAALLEKHDGEHMQIKAILAVFRTKIFLQFESMHQEEKEGNGLWTYDEHTTTTAPSKQGTLFAEHILRALAPADRETIIGAIGERLSDDCHCIPEDLFSKIPLLRQSRIGQRLASPLLSFLESLLHSSAQKAAARLQKETSLSVK